jgi:hypothetical protein
VLGILQYVDLHSRIGREKTVTRVVASKMMIRTGVISCSVVGQSVSFTVSRLQAFVWSAAVGGITSLVVGRVFFGGKARIFGF